MIINCHYSAIYCIVTALYKHFRVLLKREIIKQVLFFSTLAVLPPIKDYSIVWFLKHFPIKKIWFFFPPDFFFKWYFCFKHIAKIHLKSHYPWQKKTVKNQAICVKTKKNMLNHKNKIFFNKLHFKRTT